MKYNNTVIKVKSAKHGKKVIKWWQQQGVEQGVDTSDFMGNKLKYCGVIDYKFDYYDLLTVLQHKAKIIELPNELPEYGDRILVWDYDEKEAKATERIFLNYIKGATYPVIVVSKDTEENFHKGETFTFTCFRYWKPIPEKVTIEITMKEIADLLNVDVDQIKIKD